MVSELGMEVVDLVVVVMVAKLGTVQSTISVGVILIEFTLLCIRITGLEVLFVTGIFPFMMLITCGSGQWFAFYPSTSAVWSGIVVSKLIESHGNIILFVLTDIKLYLSVFKGL